MDGKGSLCGDARGVAGPDMSGAGSVVSTCRQPAAGGAGEGGMDGICQRHVLPAILLGFAQKKEDQAFGRCEHVIVSECMKSTRENLEAVQSELQ